MQYALLVYNNEAAWETITPDDQKKGMAAYKAFTEALKNAGAFTLAHGLSPSPTATTVRVTKGKSQVLNGPYAESKEQLGGFFVIDVPDLDAAISWAARCPSAEWGAVEVRPLWRG